MGLARQADQDCQRNADEKNESCWHKVRGSYICYLWIALCGRGGLLLSGLQPPPPLPTQLSLELRLETTSLVITREKGAIKLDNGTLVKSSAFIAYFSRGKKITNKTPVYHFNIQFSESESYRKTFFHTWPEKKVSFPAGKIIAVLLPPPWPPPCNVLCVCIQLVFF